MRADIKQSPTREWIEAIRQKYPTETFVDRALTRKLGVRSGPPHRPVQAAQVIERLQPFLQKRLPGKFSISEVRALTGGSSKEQFVFRLQWRDERGQSRNEKFILRLQPTESIVETHRLREFQVMKALKGTLPVPDAIWVDPEGEELGQPALICSFCQGVARPPVEGLITGPTGGFGPKYRPLLAPQFVKYLAQLGRFDWRNADLSSFGVPREGTNEAVIWAINWWHRVWEEDSTEPMPFITLVAQWLRENAPPVDHVSLLHNDYKGGNFLFLVDTGEVTAILDWELAHLGDRHQDLALAMDPIYGERDDDGNLLVCGLFPREEFLREYERLSGLPVDPVRLRYYEIFTSWRSAVISLATAPRCAQAQKTHMDILLAWVSSCAFPLMGNVYGLIRDQF